MLIPQRFLILKLCFLIKQYEQYGQRTPITYAAIAARNHWRRSRRPSSHWIRPFRRRCLASHRQPSASTGAAERAWGQWSGGCRSVSFATRQHRANHASLARSRAPHAMLEALPRAGWSATRTAGSKAVLRQLTDIGILRCAVPIGINPRLADYTAHVD